MEIIKFNDFMSGNYKYNKYESVTEAVLMTGFKVVAIMGIAVFGMIFLEQFIHIMQKIALTDVLVPRPIRGV